MSLASKKCRKARRLRERAHAIIVAYINERLFNDDTYVADLVCPVVTR